MKQINLLPPLKQKHLLNLYIFLFVRFIFILLLSVTIIVSVILGGAFLLLNESIQQVTIHASAIDKEFNAVNKEISLVNGKLKQIDFVIAAKKAWSARLFAIMRQITPPTVSLSGLTVANNGNSIVLQGNAQNRNALLDAQTRLKNLNFIEDAAVPLDNLIREQNLEFQMTLQLKN